MTVTDSRPLALGRRSCAPADRDCRDLDIRPLITRHRLRRRRRRTAATLLTGASLALGAAAIRSPGVSAHHPVTGAADARAQVSCPGSGGPDARSADSSAPREQGALIGR